MKRACPFTIIATLIALAFSALAQVAGPPATVDYQGRLLNNLGGPITGSGGAGTTGTATNYQINFRIWSAQSGGDLIWAEKQVVTVTEEGFFSVRLGEGEAIPATDSNPNPVDPAVANGAEALLSAFDGSERFVGVTVIVPGQAPGEISPRLAFLSAPYALVAGRVADASVGGEQIADNAVGSAAIAGSAVTGAKIASATITETNIANGAVTGAKIGDGSITAADIANSAVTGAKIADGTITGADIGNGQVTSAKLGSDVGKWSVNGANDYLAVGRVGIGRWPTGSYRLDVNGSAYIHGTIYGRNIYGGSTNYPNFMSAGSGRKVWFKTEGNSIFLFSLKPEGGYSFKSFIIDHPNNPDKHLVHVALEGPEVAVFYRGTGRLNNGSARIELPAYFEKLTEPKGHTIQLTPIDGFDSLAIRSSDGVQITAGSFEVYSDNPESTQRFNWEVMARRFDSGNLVVEPNRSDITVHGDGPYTYSTPKAGSGALEIPLPQVDSDAPLRLTATESAQQEASRESLEAKVAELTAELASLKAKGRARDAKLSAIEIMLSERELAIPVTTTASVAE